MNRDPQDLLPLTPVVFHTLLALVDGTSHGYVIAQEVERRTEGKVRMGPGTLYGSLRRMGSQGLIEEIEKPRDASAHRERRRYYALTELGRRVLRAETRRLASVVAFASHKLDLAEARAS